MTRVWPTDNPDANGEMNWSAYSGWQLLMIPAWIVIQ